MSNWKPITEEEFTELFERQYRKLNTREREVFDRFRVPFWKAKISRSSADGIEYVFVVAEASDGVLYFDDVEFGFNISRVENGGHILEPGGSQNSLKEALLEWFPIPK